MSTDKTHQKDASYNRKALSELYRETRRDPAYRSPESLDDKVLAMAEQQLPQRRVGWQKHWMGIAATACVLCISLLVDLQSPDGQWQPLESPAPSSASPSSAQERIAPADTFSEESLSDADERAFAETEAVPIMGPSQDQLRKSEPSIQQHESYSTLQEQPMLLKKSRGVNDSTAVSAQAKRTISHEASSAAMPQAPKAWLLNIDRLINEGQHEKALEHFNEFRKRFPDHPVDKTLLEQLGLPLDEH